MNKKIFLIFIVGIFMISLVSSLDENLPTYRKAVPIDLKLTCTLNGAQCSDSAECNITIKDFNQSYVVSLTSMTNKGNGDFNISLNSTQMSHIGINTWNMFCTDGGEYASGQGFYLITKSGENRETNIYIPLFAIMFFGAFFFILGFVFLFINRPVKFLGLDIRPLAIGVFFTLSLLMAFVCVQYTLIIMQGYSFIENTEAESYFTTLLRVLSWIIGGAFTIAIIGLTVSIKNYFNIKKGFVDNF